MTIRLLPATAVISHVMSNTCVQRCLASAREAKRILSWFDGEARFLAFNAGLVRAARALGFAIPR
jgi:hypothetical protein